jgi:hypothetical protein
LTTATGSRNDQFQRGAVFIGRPFRFLPGLMSASAFRARCISPFVQSRTCTPPTFTGGGGANVRLATWPCGEKVAWRVARDTGLMRTSALLLKRANVLLGKVARPERVELPTFWFVARLCSHVVASRITTACKPTPLFRGVNSVARNVEGHRRTARQSASRPDFHARVNPGSTEARRGTRENRDSENSQCFIGYYGAPGRIRTSDLVLRRHTLYPTELRARRLRRERYSRTQRRKLTARFYSASYLMAKQSRIAKRRSRKAGL